jgi:hypothetical protein
MALELKDFLTVITVALGWYVVHRASEHRDVKKLLLELRRDSKKERRELARDSLKLLRELEDQAVRFHTKSEYDSTIAESVFRMLERFGRELSLLAPQEHPVIFAKLRQSITLDNFEKDDFQQKELNSGLLVRLRSCVVSAEQLLLPMTRLFQPPTNANDI